LDGLGGTDTLQNIQQINGTSFADSFFGGAGSQIDWFRGEGGNDTLNGGTGGVDTADYRTSTAGVTVNLATGVAVDGLGGTDTLVSIEQIRGSSFGDTLTGSTVGGEIFRGLAGNDTIVGGGTSSNGQLDIVDYRDATAAVSVNLAAGIAADGLGGSDTLTNIQSVRGSAQADSFAGSTLDDWFRGNAGSDSIDGAAGTDWADYASASAAVSVTMSVTTLGYVGTVNEGSTTDSLVRIEAIQGSSFDDTFVGSTADDWFRGAAGNDTLTGNNGNDTADYASSSSNVIVNLSAANVTVGANTLAAGTAVDGLGGTDTLSGIEVVRGGSGNDSLFGSSGADTVYGGSGNDSVSGGSSGDVLYGDAGNDTVRGGAGDDILAGGAGDDLLSGGAAFDRVTYEFDSFSGTSGVTIDLGAGLATIDRNGEVEVDTLISIEDATGSAQNDIIYGDANVVNTLFGLGGNDTLYGIGGGDNLNGGAGNDRLVQTSGTNANMNGGSGADTFAIESNGSTNTATIQDFTRGDGDKIDLSALNWNVNATNFASVIGFSSGTTSTLVLDDGSSRTLTVANSGSNVTISDGNGTIQINGQQRSTLQFTDFIF
jgi:Ca2+-binding RTX toxin-like protein